MNLDQTLAALERVLGPDHPSTLASRNNLAIAYVEAGRAAEAIPLFEQTLAARERVLGPDHPRTLTSRKKTRQRLPGGGPGRLKAAYGAGGYADEQISWPTAVGRVLHLRWWPWRQYADRW